MRGIVAVSVLATGVFLACATGTEPVPDDVEPTLREDSPLVVGRIVDRAGPSPSSGGFPTIHVGEAECGIIFAVRDSTPIRRKTDGGSFVEVPLEQLVKGTTVAVWAKGYFTSCPGQSGADAIEVF